MGKLEPNWDSYGSAPPSLKALATARNVLKGNVALKAVPSASGGIDVYLKIGAVTSYIAIDSNGDQYLVEHDGKGNL
jgi:hypothetical protein